MADPGLMFACFGCCGGHANNGAARFVRPALRRAFDAAGLQGRVLAARSFSWTGGGIGPEPS